MKAESNLSVLLKNINPRLASDEYVFCTVSKSELDGLGELPLCFFQEEEGLTIIIPRSLADAHELSYSGTWAWITCEVHSDLTAVGFMAAISRCLADEGIPTNPVSAFYHDHLFVPFQMAPRAVQLIKGLSQ
jgi:uncharacterized protein